MIKFIWDGIEYEAPMSFYEKEIVMLPDGILLKADGFYESLPPQPRKLHRIEIPKAVLKTP